jgi:hypothetical protein
MSMTLKRAQEFKIVVEEKIERLLDEFAGGDISREHFDIVYSRYSRQLGIAEEAIENGKLDDLNQLMNEIPTMALRAAIRGKALSMMVIHHLELSTIRTFGEYELDEQYLNPIMEQLQHRLSIEQKEYTDVQKLYSNSWVIVCSLEHTTLITLFRNEPASKQVQELERRHRDFESANRNILNLPNPNPDTLVYPVELFVRNK